MFENKNARTELSSLGEFGLIKHLTEHIAIHHDSTVKGVGDDAAVLEYKNKEILVSTDMLVEGVHFDLTYVPLKHLGYKAISSNVSDICAMNGTAKQVTVSIALSNRFSVEAVEELYSGMLLACNNYKVDMVGGDTTSSLSGLIISITVLGEAEKEEIVYRNGAKEKDLLVVTGDLGGAYMGLQILEREKAVFKENPNLQPDLEGNDYILERQLKPEARIDIKAILKEKGVHPTSMIDISDGLASEILHLCTQSNVGCNLFEDKIPLDGQTSSRAHEFKLDPTICALSGGEDYELLFTIPQSDYDKVKGHPDFTVIGHMTDKASGVNMITRSGTSVQLTAQGWDAFLKK
ncbi:MAG: thiamine-phosphate kinase [Bacteroidia bacterium]